MKKRKQNSGKPKAKLSGMPLIRKNIVSISLNDPEYKALQKYCTKYNITNRSRFIRESMMKIVITKICEDYPTLFKEEDMRQR